MDLRRPGPDQPIRISPTHDYEPSAPSPDSIAASPMISARMSDCAEMPLESDDGDACSYASRRSTFSTRMEYIDLTKDVEFQKKYPELYKLYMTNSKLLTAEKGEGSPVGRDTDHLLAIVEEIKEYYRELRELRKHLRHQQKYTEKLSEENRQIKESWAKIYAQAEQEEEYISNTLLKRIHQLKSEKEMLAQRYETEMNTLNNDLQKTINQLQSERDVLEGKLKKEHTSFVDGLLKRIRNMENDIDGFRQNIDRLRVEKIDQENALEHEQELLFNTLGKQMDQINAEKRSMQVSLEKAYRQGFVDPDIHLAVLNPPPLVFKEQLHNCNGEVMRLRVQLKRAEGQINEMKDREASKDARIRSLEEHNKHLKWYKERYQKMRHMFDSDAPPEMSPEPSNPILMNRVEINMGPPSVPPTPRSIDNSSDMDETASYPASVDMN